MRLSDISVQRPVLAMVIAALIVVFGALSLLRLPLQEYPAVDPPIITIDTRYPGASARVVETRVTRIIEERVAGVEGIELITSRSQDGRSRVEVEFGLDKDINAAANDMRDRVSGALRSLPDDAGNPEVSKADSSEEVVVWLSLSGEGFSIEQLTDYANRQLVDRFAVQPGVARVRVGGGKDYAMRVWIDRNAMAARGLTINDIESSLRAENLELPAGSLESRDRQFIVRLPRRFNNADDFSALALAQGDDGYVVRLGDVARVEVGSVEDRSVFRANGNAMVGLGMVRQSTANVIELSDGVRSQMERLQGSLPDGMALSMNYDASVFVSGAIRQVVMTLLIAMGLVVVVILAFLGSLRTTLIPAITVPIAVIGAFIALNIMGFSINLLTLLALVLAIGLIVDDAIVVLENINRRMHQYRESPLVAAYRGSRQIAFAVIATTLVLVAVFVPLAMLEGDIGQLFSEFALTMAAAVAISSLLALTLTPMMASRLLRAPRPNTPGKPPRHRVMHRVQDGYRTALRRALTHRWLAVVVFLGVLSGSIWITTELPTEYTPKEDRGSFIILVGGPEGATFRYMLDYMNEIEQRLEPLIESGDLERVVVRTPRGFGNIENFNSGFVIVNMAPWDQRRGAQQVMGEVRRLLGGLPGVRAFPIMRQGFGQRTQKPVQFVLGGADYQQLAEWRDTLLAHIRQDNPRLTALDSNYSRTQPQLDVAIDYPRAAALGVTVSDIGRTLEVLLGGRSITRYVDDGQEYDVIVEGERSSQQSPAAIDNIQVRSARSGELIPLANLVSLTDTVGASTLNRFDRMRSITLEANLADGYPLGEAIESLEKSVETLLPERAQTRLAGPSRDFQDAGGATLFLFGMGLLVVFMVLAAQFESLIHPLVIMATVPLAMAGALLALWLSGQSLNVYSQVGLVLLVGLAAKNGVLIVEFANQLRDSGYAFRDALVESCVTRLRPILMTAITTMAGAIPLVVSSGPGAESRLVIGTVIMAGIASATLLTLFIVPVAYDLLARRTGSPQTIRHQLERELVDQAVKQ